MGDDKPVVAPVNAPDEEEKFTEHMKGLFPDITDEQLTKAWEVHSSKTLTERIVEATQDYGAMLVKNLQVKFDEQLEETMKTQQKAIVDGVRGALGVDDNPAIHLKDLDSIVRDLVIKHSDPKKKGAVGDDDDDQPSNDTPGDDDPFKTFDFAKRLEADLKTRGGPHAQTITRRGT